MLLFCFFAIKNFIEIWLWHFQLSIRRKDKFSFFSMSLLIIFIVLQIKNSTLNMLFLLLNVAGFACLDGQIFQVPKYGGSCFLGSECPTFALNCAYKSLIRRYCKSLFRSHFQILQREHINYFTDISVPKSLLSVVTFSIALQRFARKAHK